jgi:hypothetical protein
VVAVVPAGTGFGFGFSMLAETPGMAACAIRGTQVRRPTINSERTTNRTVQGFEIVVMREVFL